MIARQTIHMKYQTLFSLKINKKNYFRILSAAVITGTLWFEANILWNCIWTW